jgi:hypothetical protein
VPEQAATTSPSAAAIAVDAAILPIVLTRSTPSGSGAFSAGQKTVRNAIFRAPH